MKKALISLTFHAPELSALIRQLFERAEVGDDPFTLQPPRHLHQPLVRRVHDALHEHQVAIEDVNVRRPSLDDVFLTLTGRAAEPDKTSEELQEEVIR